MTQQQELVWKLIDQTITSEEFKELEAALMEDAELRGYYQDCLEESDTFAQISASEKIDAGKPRAIPQNWNRQGFAASIGLLIGVLSTTAVFGFVAPRVDELRPTLISVMRDAFEDPSQTFTRGIARYANEWFFHGNVEVLKSDNPAPVSGDHILRIAPSPERSKGQVHYLIDLEDYPEVVASTNRRIQVGSHFYTSGEGGGEYAIRIGAFAEAPEEVGVIWTKPSDIQDRALQQVSRKSLKNEEQVGWQELIADMSLPEGTRTIIIGILASHDSKNPGDSSRYLDAVSMQFVLDAPDPLSGNFE